MHTFKGENLSKEMFLITIRVTLSRNYFGLIRKENVSVWDFLIRGFPCTEKFPGVLNPADKTQMGRLVLLFTVLSSESADWN